MDTLTQEATRMIRVLIADDHAMVRSGLRKLLDFQSDIQVVAEAADGQKAVNLTIQYEPDVLLLDLAMPSTSGIQALRKLAELELQTKTIVLTAAIERSSLLESVQLGARGVMLKESDPDLLFKCIRSVAAGHYWLDEVGISDVAQAFRQLAVHEPVERHLFGLTPRELEIVAGIIAAHGTKQVAAKLNISAQTVKNHLTTIFDKLGVSNRLELALFVASHQALEQRLARLNATSDRHTRERFASPLSSDLAMMTFGESS